MGYKSHATSTAVNNIKNVSSTSNGVVSNTKEFVVASTS
jgi:hypothetical protein